MTYGGNVVNSSSRLRLEIILGWKKTASKTATSHIRKPLGIM